MTAQAVGGAAPTMRALAFAVQVPHQIVVEQGRGTRCKLGAVVTVAAGSGPGRPEHELTVGILPAAHRDGSKGAPVLGVAVHAIATAVEKRTVQVNYPGRRMAVKFPGCVAVQARTGGDSDEWLVAIPAPLHIGVDAANVARGPDHGGNPPGAPGQQRQQYYRNAGRHPASRLRQRQKGCHSRSPEVERAGHVSAESSQEDHRHRRVQELPHAEGLGGGGQALQPLLDFFRGQADGCQILALLP